MVEHLKNEGTLNSSSALWKNFVKMGPAGQQIDHLMQYNLQCQAGYINDIYTSAR